MPTVSTYPKLRQDWLKHENDSKLYRKEVTILAAAGDLITGTVMARITKGASSSAAKSGGNTGGGTLTLDVTTPILAGAKAGVYSVRCVSLVANGGVFEVRDPDGVAIGLYTIGGAAFARQIKFAMADSGTDFALGDGFDITIAAGSGKWKKHVNGAVNGTEVAAGILLDARDVSGGADVKGVIVTGQAEIVSAELTWDSSVDDAPKKAAALAQLEAIGIQTRRLA
jgi:hypothetical protein